MFASCHTGLCQHAQAPSLSCMRFDAMWWLSRVVLLRDYNSLQVAVGWMWAFVFTVSRIRPGRAVRLTCWDGAVMGVIIRHFAQCSRPRVRSTSAIFCLVSDGLCISNIVHGYVASPSQDDSLLICGHVFANCHTRLVQTSSGTMFDSLAI